MNERNGLNSYKKILRSAFELEQTPLGQPLRLCINDRSIVTFRPYFSVARSSDLCALMVALNLDFKQVSRELADRTVPGPEHGRPLSKVVRQTLTIESSRQEMRQFMSEHRSCSHSRKDREGGGKEKDGARRG